MNDWCCITALLIWLFRKLVPRSMYPSCERPTGGREGCRRRATEERCARQRWTVTSPSDRGATPKRVRLQLAREDATTDLRVVERQRLRGFDREVLEGVQEG